MHHRYPTFSMYKRLWLGTNLTIYNEIASKISDNILNRATPLLSIADYKKLSKSKWAIVRYASKNIILGIFVGKAAMTSTGKATLLAAAFTRSIWIYNGMRDPEAADLRADKDREAARDREH